MRVNYRVQKQTGKWILDRSVVQSNSQSSSTVADTALTHQHHLQHIGKVTEKISDFLLGLMFTDYAHSKINSFWDIRRGRNCCCALDCFVNSLCKVCWRTLLCGVGAAELWILRLKRRNSFLTHPLLLLHAHHHLLLTSWVSQTRAYIPLAALSWDVSSSDSSYLMSSLYHTGTNIYNLYSWGPYDVFGWPGTVALKGFPVYHQIFSISSLPFTVASSTGLKGCSIHQKPCSDSWKVCFFCLFFTYQTPNRHFIKVHKSLKWKLIKSSPLGCKAYMQGLWNAIQIQYQRMQHSPPTLIRFQSVCLFLSIFPHRTYFIFDIAVREVRKMWRRGKMSRTSSLTDQAKKLMVEPPAVISTTSSNSFPCNVSLWYYYWYHCLWDSVSDMANASSLPTVQCKNQMGESQFDLESLISVLQKTK